MTHELREQGLAAGLRRVARLMRKNGLKARQPRRLRRTTDSGHAFPIASNHLDQFFTAAGPDRKWGSDISYILDAGGLAVPGGGPRPVLPTDSRLGGGRPASQGTPADRVLIVRQPGPSLLHHSDRSIEYFLNEYEAEL